MTRPRKLVKVQGSGRSEDAWIDLPLPSLFHSRMNTRTTQASGSLPHREYFTRIRSASPLEPMGVSCHQPWHRCILDPPSPLYLDQMNTSFHRPVFPLLAGLPFAGEKGDRYHPKIFKPVLPATPVRLFHDTIVRCSRIWLRGIGREKV